MRPNQRKIDIHGDEKKVLQMVLDEVPYKKIGQELGYDTVTVRRYVEQVLFKRIAVGSGRKRQKLTDDFMETLSYLQKLNQEYINACLDWLRSPSTKKITFNPRAEELSVVYDEPVVMDDGKIKIMRREDTLQALLDKALQCNEDESGFSKRKVQKVRYLRQDPRDKILDALDEARKQSELIARVTGELKDLAQTTDVYQVVTMVIKALTDDEAIPVDKRRALIKRIEEGMAVIEQEMLVG